MSEKKKRILYHAVKMLTIIFIIMAIEAVAFKFYAMNYYKADGSMIADIADENSGVNVVRLNEDVIAFEPVGKEVTDAIIFYPGGKVEYTAYESLMYEIASRGVVCILPRMPENIAFLGVDAAQGLDDYYPDIKNWYLAGHSLGGVAASKYFAENYDKYVGLILCASYTTSDLSSLDTKVLTIYGSEDKVLNIEKYNESKSLLPADSTEYIIEGGCHSYFGSYGIQDGDGDPTITNEEQLKITAEQIANWID